MIDSSKLKGVEQTLFIPLLIKAAEYNHPHPIIEDRKAHEIVAQLNLNRKNYKINRYSAVATLFRARKFDSYVARYLQSNPEGTIIEIGAGLDTRFYRTDNGKASWIIIDLPNVIKLRTHLFGYQERVVNLDLPIDQIDWSRLCDTDPKPLIIAEGVFVYIEREQVLQTISHLCDAFEGSLLCFDVMSNSVVTRQSFKSLEQHGVVLKWGIDDSAAFFNPKTGCKILEEWRYYDKFERRNGFANLLKFSPGANNMFRVLKVKLKR